MKGSLRALGLVLALWGTAVYGCKCTDMPLERQLRDAEVALVADVLSPHLDPDIRGHATLRVTRSLKGGIAPGTIVQLDPLSGTSCGGYVPEGSQILVFAYRDGPAEFLAGKCSIHGTKPLIVEGARLEPSAEVVEFLRRR